MQTAIGHAVKSAAATPEVGGPRRLFRALVFDWDGTAVASRQEDATALAGLLAALLQRAVWVVVITGTNFGHIERQLCRLIAPALRPHLLICTNRGSEVYGFEPDGSPVRRWLRQATPEEERALTATAEAVRDAIVARTGLNVRIVYDRLNRRKIDLIPLSEWADPAKAQIGALLTAVEQRLQGAGLHGGLGEAVRLTERLAGEHGLPNARITSDVKHIEVGLTDKGDSLAWINEQVLEPEGIPRQDMLVAGDEFGPIAGFAGSDDQLRKNAEGAAVVSVGPEPNGAPPGVRHLGGGPARFRALLAEQVRLHGEGSPCSSPASECPHLSARPRADVRWIDAALRPPADARWQLTAHTSRPSLEHELESRFAVGNGFLGVRGSADQASGASRPRTFIAGLFATPRDSDIPGLVRGPDWLRLRLRLNGEPVRLDPRRGLPHVRTLDYRRGVLIAEWAQRDRAGRGVRLHTLRFVSLARRELAVQVSRIDVEQLALLRLEAGLDPPGETLEVLQRADGLTVWRVVRGEQRLATASALQVRLGQAALRPVVQGAAGQRTWQWEAQPGQPAILLRLVTMARGRSDSASGAQAAAALRRARRAGLPRLLAAHERAWAARWAASDVEIEGDDAAQRGLRFAVYQLNSAANPDDEHVSIGARALTGDAYLGHVFWDTEILLLPFYTLTWPAAARALLRYRYHTLPAARAKAARLGYQGALYAWESADTGAEATPARVIGPAGEVITIRCGTDEQHISADIAYAVWQYWQATGDTTFLLQSGAEIILETARFWASRARSEADGRYHIRRVIGPDEYHEVVDDNAYTNGMARWNLTCGLAVADHLERRWPERWATLCEQLHLSPGELERWGDVAARLVTGLDTGSGLVEQFAGFFGLEPVDLAAYASRTAPMDILLGPERTRRSQVIKQADVVMLLALLWDQFSPAVREANFRYYEPRCGHGSSLSPAIHALVAARLGDVALAERYFHQTAAIDLDDAMGNAALGIHIGALGGLWQAAVFGFAGLRPEPAGLWLDPHLPAGWQTLRFPVQWRGRRVRISVQQAPLRLTATLERGRPLMLTVGELRHRLHRGHPWRCVRDADGRWRES